MVEEVTSRKLYQVTLTNWYKQAFTLNQTINVGVDHNPFFKFYEYTLTYPVTDGDTGATIQVNAVDWLRRVRAGTIRTSHQILAEKAFEVSEHYMMLARELLMKQIRLEQFGGKLPS